MELNNKNMKKIIKVVAAVICSKNKNGQSVILATQRGYGEFKGGVEVIERNNKKCRIYAA